MTEILFYHLTDNTLEQVLPGLLEKCLERDWRVVVQAGSRERVDALDAHLWTWADHSFLPHGATRDGSEADQPIWLTDGDDNPNGAAVRFVVDGAEPPDLAAYERGIYLFDGHSSPAVEQARARWTIEKDAGNDVTYWRQKPGGGWEKKA